MRQKMGKPVSTYWHDAHKWNDRAKAEGYKVDKNPNLVHYLLLNKVQAVMMGIMVMWLLLLV